MKAEIFSIGTELLLGNVVDTNSQFIAEQCAALGIQVYHMQTLGDNPTRVREAFQEALSHVDMIIATGGLGPTTDDLTKEMAMEAMGQKGAIHEETYARLKEQFNHEEDRIQNNIKQAIFPTNAYVLKNDRGTAPGCILLQDGKYIVLLPGPPHEMIGVFEEFKSWYLKSFKQDHLYSKTLRFTGIGESDLNALMKDLFEQRNPSIAPYAKPQEVTLRVTAFSHDAQDGLALVNEGVRQVQERVGQYIYGFDNDTLARTIFRFLQQQNLSIATAESLTGGAVAAELVEVEGISEVYKGSIVAYQDEVKERFLHVSRETLEKHSAVSRECLEEMLIGICKATGSKIGLATTGYAGPTGDVGHVWIGVRINGVNQVKELQIHGQRTQIIRRTVRQVLTLLWNVLKSVSRETIE